MDESDDKLFQFKNMVVYKENKVQRGHAFAVVDEVDSILIDEARTPLIISGRGDKSTELYTQVDKFARSLTPYIVVEMDNKVDQELQKTATISSTKRLRQLQLHAAA